VKIGSADRCHGKQRGWNFRSMKCVKYDEETIFIHFNLLWHHWSHPKTQLELCGMSSGKKDDRNRR